MIRRMNILSFALLFTVISVFAAGTAHAEDGTIEYSGFGEELFANQGHPALSGPATVADVLSGLEPAAGTEAVDKADDNETKTEDKAFFSDVTEKEAQDSGAPVAGNFGP